MSFKKNYFFFNEINQLKFDFDNILLGISFEDYSEKNIGVFNLGIISDDNISIPLKLEVYLQRIRQANAPLDNPNKNRITGVIIEQFKELKLINTSKKWTFYLVEIGSSEKNDKLKLTVGFSRILIFDINLNHISDHLNESVTVSINVPKNLL